MVQSQNFALTSVLQLLPSNLLDASQSIASAATTSEVFAGTHAITSAKEFEPILPDTSALLGILAIVLASAAATWVWANQVVPTSRTKLALQKREGGEVNDYLEELKADKKLENGGERKLEQWLFTDWLEQKSAKTGRQKEPALPILKKAKWNSGDNPVLAATALIMAGVFLASAIEKLTALFS